MNDDESGCKSMEPRQDLIINGGSRLRVKVSNTRNYSYKVW